MEWIRVGDRLPKEARLEVLVTNGHSVAPAWWVGGRFEAFCAAGMVLRWVTHWARFPAPPLMSEVLQPESVTSGCTEWLKLAP